MYADILDKPGLLEQLALLIIHLAIRAIEQKGKNYRGPSLMRLERKRYGNLFSLRAKVCGYSLVGKEKIKAKGISRAVVKNRMTLDDYKNCLFEGLNQIKPKDTYSAYRNMTSFRSYKHEVKTISTNKLALNRYDDKRYVMENRIDTLPWGHYKIE